MHRGYVRLPKQASRTRPKRPARSKYAMKINNRKTSQAVAQKNHLVEAAPKIPKGFVMINLDAHSQQELRNLAKECGYELRNVLRWALFDIRQRLEEELKLRRRTGMNQAERRAKGLCVPINSRN